MVILNAKVSTLKVWIFFHLEKDFNQNLQTKFASHMADGQIEVAPSIILRITLFDTNNATFLEYTYVTLKIQMLNYFFSYQGA